MLDCAPAIEPPDSSAAIFEDAEFNAFALELFNLQYQHNGAYRIFCESRHVTPETLGEWGQIPAVPAAAFKEWDLSCLPEHERTTVFFSSGTTAHRPSRHFHNESSLNVYETSLRKWFRAHFLLAEPHSFATALSLTPTQLQAPNSSLVHMFETLRRDRIASSFAFTGQADIDGAWSLDVAATTGCLETSTAAKEPVLLLGTAFSYVYLLDFLTKRKLSFQLPPGSAILETGGYKGRTRVLPKKELHELMTLWLGVPAPHIICEYGMSELSSQAYDRRLLKRTEQPRTRAGVGSAEFERLFQFPPWVRVQIVSPETGHEVAEGETGLIRVFDLANVYSVMAIQTEDLAVKRAGGFELIGRAELSEPRGCSLMTV